MDELRARGRDYYVAKYRVFGGWLNSKKGVCKMIAATPLKLLL